MNMRYLVWLLIVFSCGVTSFAGDCRLTPDLSDDDRADLIRALKDGDRLVIGGGVHRLTRRLLVQGKRDVVIEGENGAVLMTHFNPAGSEKETNGAFLLDGCENLVVRNLCLTTDNNVGCQGKVVGTDEAGHTITLEIDPEFVVTGKEHYFMLTTVGEDLSPDAALELCAHIHPAQGDPNRYVGVPYDVIGANLVRVRVPERFNLKGISLGHRMIVRYARLGEVPITVAHCTNVTLEDIELERSSAMGMVVMPSTRDLVFRRFNARPARGSGHWFSANADVIHIVGCRGGIVMEDCHFRGIGDDVLNVHSAVAEVRSVKEDGRFEMFLRGPALAKDFRFSEGWGSAGDELELYDLDYRRLGRLMLKSYDGRTNSGVVTVREGRLPRPGELLVNAAFYPSVRISDCEFEHTRARAILLRTRNVKVERSLFRGFPLSAILFSADFGLWGESGPAEDVEVVGCRFENCARHSWGKPLGALVVKADDEGGENERPAGIFRRFRFLDNVFVDSGSSGIYIASADDVEIGGNSFSGGSANPALDSHNRFDIRIKNCTNVKLGRNESDRDTLVKMDSGSGTH